MRVVASIEVANSREAMVLYVLLALWSMHSELCPSHYLVDLPPWAAAQFLWALPNWQLVLKIDDFRLLTTNHTFGSCIRRNTTTIALNRSLLQLRSTNVSLLQSKTSTLHTGRNEYQTQIYMYETRTSLIAQHLPYPRQLGQLNPRPRSFNLGGSGKERWKEIPLLESGRSIWHAQEVFRREKVFYWEGYKATCSSFCSFKRSSHSSLIFFTVSRLSLHLSKSFVLAYAFLVLRHSLISLIYYCCSYQ